MIKKNSGQEMKENKIKSLPLQLNPIINNLRKETISNFIIIFAV